jgi:hypothetical protein
MKSRSLVRIAAAAGLTSRAGFHRRLDRESAVAGKASDVDRMPVSCSPFGRGLS